MNTVNLGGRRSKTHYADVQSISSAGATITLTMRSRKYLQVFNIPLLIGAAKIWAVSLVASLGFFKVRFSITAGFDQTLPADWKLSDANYERVTASCWTPSDTGEYEMEGTYNGTDWVIKIFGPIAN
jgi:hypothetical protein